MASSGIIFEVRKEETDGGYCARAVGHDIFTQGDSLEELTLMVHDAVKCHFGNSQERPQMIRLFELP